MLRSVPDLFGGITLLADERGLRAITFNGRETGSSDLPVLIDTEEQLREYAAGERSVFELPLHPEGTSFQREVWRALAAIPYAETRSYRDIALAVNRPRGFQAIGQANTRNPLPIVIPCHRVINADGSLGGYGGGIERKQTLLILEKQNAHRYRQTTASGTGLPLFTGLFI